MANVALADLVLPYLLRGENLGAQHAALSALRVVSWETSSDDFGVVMRGRCEFNGQALIDPFAGGLRISADTTEGSPAFDPEQRSAVFDIRETSLEFELFVPRAGSQIIADGATSVTAGTFAPVRAVLDSWDVLPVDPAPSDYPATGFTLDLLLKAPSLRPPFLHAAKLNELGLLMPDASAGEVELGLPRLRFRMTHGNSIGAQLTFDLVSAGVSTLDDPGDIGVAELITMKPPYAFVGGENDRVFGIGFRSATLDLSNESTPPSVLAKAQVGDDWTGLYLPEVRVFISPSGVRDFAFEAGANELLIGFGAGDGVWGDLEAMLVNQGSGELKIGVRFVDQPGRTYGIERVDATHARARIPELTRMAVDVSGGRTPYTRSVQVGAGAAQTGTTFLIDLSAESSQTVLIAVRDGSSPSVESTLTIEVSRRVATPQLPAPGDAPTTPLLATIDPPADSPVIVIASQNEREVLLTTQPADANTTWTVDGTARPGGQSSISIDVTPGQSRTVTAHKPGSAVPAILSFYFYFDEPPIAIPAGESAALLAYASVGDNLSTVTAVSKIDRRRSSGHQDPMGAYRRYFDLLPLAAALRIRGEASYEGDDAAVTRRYNYQLARRRAIALRERIRTEHAGRNFDYSDLAPDQQTPDDGQTLAWATSSGWTSHGAPQDNSWWKATVALPPGLSTGDEDSQYIIRRPAAPPVVPPPERDPQPETPATPDWFRSVKLKVRIVRNELIAAEIEGEIDIQTAAEQKLQATGELDGHEPPEGRTLENGVPLGPDNPADGITKFRLLCQSDKAVGRMTTLISVGADPADKDGLITWGWMPGEAVPGKNFGLTLLGSYLSFWPMLVEASAGGKGEVADAVLTSAALVIPGVVAALPWFTVERVSLFGAEYVQRNRGEEFEGMLLFDVGIDWSANVLDLIVIDPHHPLSVRYKALGIRLGNRTDDGSEQWALRPVFDSARGYTIDVASGGALRIAEPLGQILRVMSARLSRTNPLTFEIDIALAVDLGVVSIDRAGLRVYLDDASKPPELTALAASMDIPGALVGSGYVQIAKRTVDGQEIGTIGGQIDLTLRPINLRVSAAFEIATISEADGTTATGVYVGLNVTLPVGLPLGSSGLGIFGFRGIFGMHYRRTPIGEGTGVPALAWLAAAGGQPHLLVNPNTQVRLWEPKIDRWAFGLGMLIGTMEGGVLINLDGTLLLELPGPRVLIMMNARILSPPPSLDGLGGGGGVLAVIEVTPEHFMIGLLFEWEIESLIKIVIPIEAAFPFAPNSSKWHIYLGARPDIGRPVEVDVLGIVRGTGYLMFKGDGFPKYKIHGAELPEISGFGIGLGAAASITWGNTDIGLYLRVGGGMDAVIGFDPFVLAGVLYVTGELRLFIISIGADATLTIVVNEQLGGDLALYVHGEACGHVSFLFFSIEGCVEITINSPEPPPAPLPVLVEKVALKSRSPALLVGTGVDRGIDASLGNALEDANRPALGDADLPIVPVDSIPVISLRVPAGVKPGLIVEGLGTPVDPAPGLNVDGFAERSGELYRYTLSRMALERIDPATGNVAGAAVTGSEAPVVWWTISETTTASPVAQLALFTWEPTPASKAIEKSERLSETVNERWGSVCDGAAPPAEVFWTFHDQLPGASASGWKLDGVAWPDSAGTRRNGRPDTTVEVHESWRSGDMSLDTMRGIFPAQVIEDVVPCLGPDGMRSRKCPIRVLEAPILDDGREIALGDPTDKERVNEALKAIGKEHGPLDDVIVLETGAFKSLDVLLFVRREVVQSERLVARLVDEQGTELGRVTARATDYVPPQGLPARWIDPSGPWFERISELVSWNNREQGAPLLLRLGGGERVARLELGVLPDRGRPNGNLENKLLRPDYFVGALATLRQSEIRRYEWDQSQIDREHTVITNALGGKSSQNSLMFADSLYRMTVQWEGDRKSGGSDGDTQVFWFRTDRIELPSPELAQFNLRPPQPVQLQPWMLVTLPGEHEPFWFGEEHVKLVFNTQDVDRVFAAYRKELRVRYSASSSRHPAPTVGVPHPFPLVAANLQPLQAAILSPWEEVMAGVLDDRCIEVDEERVRHCVAEIPIPLEPYTDYLLDVELVDVGAADDARGPRVYRRHFSTGGYPTFASFAAALSSVRPLARFAGVGAMESIRAHFNGRTPQGPELDEQLRAHGIGPLTVADVPRVLVFWEQAEGTLPQPSAVMIDSTEPIWRARPYPARSIDATGVDAAERWVLEATEYVQLQNTSAAGVVAAHGLIRAPGLQRALVVLAPNARGKTIKLDLVALGFPSMPFLGESERRVNIVELTLTRAPWEET